VPVLALTFGGLGIFMNMSLQRTQESYAKGTLRDSLHECHDTTDVAPALFHLGHFSPTGTVTPALTHIMHLQNIHLLCTTYPCIFGDQNITKPRYFSPIQGQHTQL
jgi:hypothetical protein